MNDDYKLKAGIVKACAGLLQDCSQPWVLDAIAQAEHYIGQDYALNESAQQTRQKLVQMVKFNITNRKKYERELLNRQFGMKISRNTLWREKKRFCFELAKLLHLI